MEIDTTKESSKLTTLHLCFFWTCNCICCMSAIVGLSTAAMKSECSLFLYCYKQIYNTSKLQRQIIITYIVCCFFIRFRIDRMQCNEKIWSDIDDSGNDIINKNNLRYAWKRTWNDSRYARNGTNLYIKQFQYDCFYFIFFSLFIQTFILF